MVDWSLGVYDPTKAQGGLSGADYVTKLFDKAAQLKAGSQYAGGDVNGAAGTLASRGDFQTAEALQSNAQRRQFAQNDEQRSVDVAQQKTTATQMQYVGQAAQTLDAIYQQHLKADGPEAAAQAVIQGFDQLGSDFQSLKFDPQKTAEVRQRLATDPANTLRMLQVGVQRHLGTVQQDDGKTLIYDQNTGQPVNTIQGKTPAPQSRTRIDGDREIFEEFRAGQWAPVSEGPRYKPSTQSTTGPFAGRTENERMRNVLLTGNPASAEYASAYALLAKPRIMFDPQTGETISQTPDMSWARSPMRGAQAGSGAGQPTVTASPGRAAPPARATFDANLNQAENDIALAEGLLFPDGQLLDRGIAMTGAGNIPLSQGREARQAIKRAVEVILRQRTGAAAPDSEVQNYVNMYAPSAFDSDEGARTKMQRLRQFFQDSRSGAASKLPGARNAGEPTRFPIRWGFDDGRDSKPGRFSDAVSAI